MLKNGENCNKLHLSDEQNLELIRHETENNRQQEVNEFIKKDRTILNQKIIELNNVFDNELLKIEYEYKRRLMEKKKQEVKLTDNHQNQIIILKKRQNKEKKDHNIFWNSIGCQLAKLRSKNNRLNNRLNNTKIKPITYYGIYKQSRWNASTLV